MINLTITHQLQRAAWFRAIAQGFIYPHAQHLIALQTSLAELQIPQCYPIKYQRLLKQSLHKTVQAWKNAHPSHLEGEYLHLFLTKASCPLHETAYGDGRSSLGRSTTLADISGFYTAFGFKITEDSPNLPDHLGTELEFYSLLLIKLAYAQQQHWGEPKRITQRALSTFLNEHLGCWTLAFIRTLREQTATPAWLSLGEVLDVLIRAECHLLKIQPMKLTSLIRNDEMQAEELICPHASQSKPKSVQNPIIQ